MKKLFAAIFAAFLTLALVAVPFDKADAQLVKVVTIANADTLLTNADTAAVTLTFDGSYKSVEGYLEEVSGTTGGKIYFQGKYPHTTATTWENLDSLTLSDVATAQYKLFTVPTVRTYAAYRFYFIKTGTGTARIRGWYVRYTGGAIMHDNPFEGVALLNKRSLPHFSLPAIQKNYINNFLIDKNIDTRRRPGYAKPVTS